MDKKAVSAFRTRINRAKSSFSCGGDMMLQMDIDGMTLEQRQELRAALINSKSPLSYPYLDKKAGV